MSKVDPTRTTTLRNAFVRDIRKRFTRLANDITRLIGKDNEFGLQVNVGQFDFPTSQDKVESFMQWLQGQVDDGFLEISSTNQVGVGLNDYWTNRYVTDSYQKGVIRARQEMTKAGLDVPSIDTTSGIGGSMSMPVHLDRLGILYTRTFNELKNITQAMSGQISRVLTQGLADGDNPRTLARKLVAIINGGGAELGITDSLGRYIPAKRRAEILARTEIIRAHHMGMVQEYRNWGLEGVKVQAEFRTAQDDRVCTECASLHGNVYSLDEIEKMIPVHPQCRCIALPSVIEEVKKVDEGIENKEGRKALRDFQDTKELNDHLTQKYGIDFVEAENNWRNGAVISESVYRKMEVVIDELERIYEKYPEFAKRMEKVNTRDVLHIMNSDSYMQKIGKSAGTYDADWIQINISGAAKIEKSFIPKIGSWSSSTMGDNSIEFASVFRHEFGHHVFFKGVQKKELDFLKKYYMKKTRVLKGDVTIYGATNYDELGAEIFSIYTSPNYKKGTLPKEIETFLEDLLTKKDVNRTLNRGLTQYKQ